MWQAYWFISYEIWYKPIRGKKTRQKIFIESDQTKKSNARSIHKQCIFRFRSAAIILDAGCHWNKAIILQGADQGVILENYSKF